MIQGRTGNLLALRKVNISGYCDIVFDTPFDFNLFTLVSVSRCENRCLAQPVNQSIDKKNLPHRGGKYSSLLSPMKQNPMFQRSSRLSWEWTDTSNGPLDWVRWKVEDVKMIDYAFPAALPTVPFARPEHFEHEARRRRREVQDPCWSKAY